MKKALAYLGCVLFAWGGLWLAVIADVSEAPYDQGGLSLLSAISFCISLLFAGYGNSITWKGEKK